MFMAVLCPACMFQLQCTAAVLRLGGGGPDPLGAAHLSPFGLAHCVCMSLQGSQDLGQGWCKATQRLAMAKVVLACTNAQH